MLEHIPEENTDSLSEIARVSKRGVHTAIRKEIDWYPKPDQSQEGSKKSGLNVGSFVNILSNFKDTVWTNMDILDLNEYAKQLEKHININKYNF